MMRLMEIISELYMASNSLININLNTPVASLSPSGLQQMILRRTMTKEECVQLAQQSNACGVATDYCPYYSFIPGVSTNESTFFNNNASTTAGECYIGPD